MSEVSRLSPFSKIGIFRETKETLNARLTAPLGLSEFALILFNVGILFIFIWNWLNGQSIFYDYQQYIGVGRGVFDVHYYYAYWAVPFFTLLGKLPGWLAIGLWGILNILGVWWGARVFGNKTWIVLSTYQLQYILFYGQITGLIIGGLGLLWWGLKHEHWPAAGLGLTISLTKYHLGGPIVVVILILYGIDRAGFVRMAIWPAAALLVSLVLYPGWPADIIYRLQNIPPTDWGSISLWRWFGPISLLVWLPALMVKLPKTEKLVLLVATYVLSFPYFQQTGLLALFVLPIGWLAWLGNLGYSFILLQWEGLQILTVVPLIIYLWLIYHALAMKWDRTQARKS